MEKYGGRLKGRTEKEGIRDPFIKLLERGEIEGWERSIALRSVRVDPVNSEENRNMRDVRAERAWRSWFVDIKLQMDVAEGSVRKFRNQSLIVVIGSICDPPLRKTMGTFVQSVLVELGAGSYFIASCG